MRASWIAALCLLSITQAAAEPYQTDDLLKLQSYGKAILSPDGQWAIIERYRPYDSAAAYDLDSFNKRMLGQVLKVDLKGRAPTEPLFAQGPHAGYWAGSLSPDGARMTVFRLEADRLSLGVAHIARQTVDWLDINPVPALLNPLPIWLDNTRLIVLAAQHQEISYPLDAGKRLQRTLPVLWRKTAEGRVSGMSIVSSDGLNQLSHSPDQLVVEVDTERGDQRQITQGQIVDIAVSADQQWLAVIEEGAGSAPNPGAFVSPNARPRQHQLRLVSLASGRSIQPCPDCNILPGLLAWSDLHPSLLVFTRSPGDDGLRGRLLRVDADSSIAVSLTHDDVQPWVPDNDSGAQIVRAGWHQGLPRMLIRGKNGSPTWSRFDGKGSADEELPCHPLQIASDAESLVLPCPSGLWRVSVDQGAVRLVNSATGLDRPSDEAFDTGITERYRAIAPVSHRSFWMQLNEQHSQALALTGRGIVAANLPPRTLRLLGFSTASGHGLAIARKGYGASQLWLIRADQKPIPLDTINEHLERRHAPVALALPSQWPGLVDWLLLPERSAPGDRLPLVVMPYPGALYPRGGVPPISPDAVASATNPLLLLGLGYAVLVPSIQHDRATIEPSTGLTEQIEAATDRAISTASIDSDRIAVFGHSFGGYTALLTASRSRRFRAIIAAAAPPDLFLQHGSLLPYDTVNLEQAYPLGSGFGWAETGQAHLRSTPWRDPDRFIRNSPYFALDRISSPVLLIHGDLDPVSVHGAERMFSGLYREGKDVSLIRFWGEGHVVRSPGNIRAMWSYIKSWLEQHLQKSGSADSPKLAQPH